MSVPRLRFKDNNGRKLPEWEERELKDVCKINQGLQIPISERFTEKGEERYFYITNQFLKKDADVQYFIKNPSSSVLCSESDILMTRTGNTGKVVTGVNGAFHNNFFKINYDRKVLNRIFLCEFLSLDKTQFLILKLAGTSTIPDLNHSDFYKIAIQFPSLPEQTKIANFLTAIDERITQLTQKHDLLKQYKKGVMQQIFSQKLRFKDADVSEFKTGKLKDFGYFYYGKSAPKSSITDDAKTPCVRYGELYSTYKECIKNIISYTNVSPDNLKFSKGGEVLVPRVGEDPLDFANCSYLPIANVAIGEMISVYNTEENGLFLTYYINTMLKKQLAKFVEGGSVSNLYFRYLEGIEITIPPLEEQTKIADFLTAIDDKITQTQTQFEAVKRYKKGLLQQMFV